MTTATEQDLLAFIKRTTRVTSLLFDLDLHPTQLTAGSRNWERMLVIVKTVKMLMDEIEDLKGQVADLVMSANSNC